MLNRILSFVLDREPVRSATGIAGVITAAFGVVAALGADIDPELVAAIGTLATVLAGWLARKRAWSPASHDQALAQARTTGHTPGGPQASTQGPEAGSVILGMVVFVAVVILGFVVCTAVVFDDDDEESMGPVATYDYDRDGDEGSRNRNGNDCQDARAECHDNDFSPQFDESPVTLIVCVHPDSCRFG